MTVNTGVKGTLAKLLATEDLVVEHKTCELHPLMLLAEFLHYLTGKKQPKRYMIF